MENLDIETIKKRSINGIVALTSRAFFLNILSFIASLIIFTYLSPKDVGIFVAVTAIQRIISFLTDFGFGAALIQKKDQLTKEDVTTTFTIQLFITLAIFLLIFSLNSVISSFFNLNFSAVKLLLVLVFTIFLSSFKVIPSILMERDIKFHRLILPQIIESFVYNALLIVLVLNNFGIDGYTWAFLVSGLVGIPAYYFTSPWKVALGIDRGSLMHLKYGLQFQAKNVLATLKDDFLTIFLSKVLSFTELGYIGFGQRNAFFIYRYIVDSATKVTFSTFSRLQDQPNVLKKTIEKSLFYTTAITFPILSGLIIVAPFIVLYVPRWHDKWEPALMSLTFFACNALVSSMSGILVNVLDATGRVKTTLRLMVMWTILTWVLTPIFILLFGYNGVAIASFVVTLTLGVTVLLVKRVVQFNFHKSILKPALATIIMGVFIYLTTQIFATDLISLIVTIICSGIVYGFCIYIFEKKQIREDMLSLR